MRYLIDNIDTTESEEDKQVMDPLDDETLALWNSTAKTNTVAFRHVFHCVPDDTGNKKKMLSNYCGI